MLSGLKGPDPPPQPCHPQNSAVSAANPTERKERAEGGGTAQRGYPARCPHCSAAAGEAGRGGGESQALLARGFGLVAHKSRVLAAWEAPCTMSGSAASLEGAGAAAVGPRHLSPSLAPRQGPAAPPRAEAGSWSVESSRGGAAPSQHHAEPLAAGGVPAR